MALNPEDLIIFKTREEEEQGKKPKKAVQKPEAPAEQPAAQQEAKPAAQPQKKPQRPAAQPEQPQPAAEMVKQVQEEIERPIPVAQAPQPTPEFAEEALEAQLGPPAPVTPQIKRRSLSAKESRRIAEHLTCELHPWRKAYAICDYCKRAFCYEDIVEYGGKYYDLDDIDKIPQTERISTGVTRYNNLSLVSSVFFMAIFLLFMYFTYSSLIMFANQAVSVGVLNFFQSISTPVELYFGEFALSLLSIAAAVLILLNTKSSYRVSVAISILTVLIFSYQYLNTQTIYYAAIAGVSFAALVILSYSRVSYEPALAEKTGAEEVLGAGALLESS